MTVILCLDDRCGMAFNNRRQSRDKAVINDILTHLNGERLIISPLNVLASLTARDVFPVAVGPVTAISLIFFFIKS